MVQAIRGFKSHRHRHATAIRRRHPRRSQACGVSPKCCPEPLPVQPRLAALSAYLGHVDPAHTYWYFQAVPDLMTVLGQRTGDADPTHRR
jgi:hypothetical protein